MGINFNDSNGSKKSIKCNLILFIVVQRPFRHSTTHVAAVIIQSNPNDGGLNTCPSHNFLCNKTNFFKGEHHISNLYKLVCGPIQPLKRIQT